MQQKLRAPQPSQPSPSKNSRPKALRAARVASRKAGRPLSKEAYDRSYFESYAEGFKAASECLQAILTSDAAKRPEDLAWSHAFDMTDFALNQAFDLLSRSPRTTAAAVGTSGLLTEMAALHHPNIGRDGSGAGGPETKFQQGAAAARAAPESNEMTSRGAMCGPAATRRRAKT
jgi:hypothetical protein